MSRLAKKPPKRWTLEEDSKLYEAVMKQANAGNLHDWNAIASEISGRTNKDCRKRWVNKVRGGLNKGPWKEDEDQTLLRAIATHGHRWALVAVEVGSRSADQCAKRWQDNLDPNLEHGNWTTHEDERLLQTVQRFGREWKRIQENEFAKRSRNDLKNRYVILTRNQSPSTSGSSRSPFETPGLSTSLTSLLALDAGLDMESLDAFAGGGDIQDPAAMASWLMGSEADSYTGGGVTAAEDLGGGQSTPAASGFEFDEGLGAHAGFDFPMEDLGVFDTTMVPGNGSDDAAESTAATIVGRPASAAGKHRSQPSTAGSPKTGALGRDSDDVTNVCLRVEGCDRETLKYLLDVIKPIKGRVTLEMNM